MESAYAISGLQGDDEAQGQRITCISQSDAKKRIENDSLVYFTNLLLTHLVV